MGLSRPLNNFILHSISIYFYIFYDINYMYIYSIFGFSNSRVGLWGHWGHLPWNAEVVRKRHRRPLTILLAHILEKSKFRSDGEVVSKGPNDSCPKNSGY